MEVVTEDRTVYQVKALEALPMAAEVLTMVEVATQAAATNFLLKPMFVRINKISMWHPSQITHSSVMIACSDEFLPTHCLSDSFI